MADGLRKAARIAGIVLIAAALSAVGYAGYNLLSAEIESGNSLAEVDKLLQDARSQPADAGGAATQPQAAAGQEDGPDEAFDPFDPAIPLAQEEPEPAGTAATARPKPAAKPSYLGKLVFESLGNRQVAVLNGATKANLNRGAVRHTRSSPAGGTGNCVIYGHRNTVFRGFDRLKKGDVIRLEVPGSTYVYRIATMNVVDPGDPAIFKAHAGRVMTLVTCYPFHYAGSAPQRYMVVCVMDE